MGYIGKNDVLGFDVPVQDVLVVKITHRLANLCQFCACFFLCKLFSHFNEPIE
jgi:hypothetical protein